MIYEFLRVLPGFIFAAITGISKDCYSMLVFFTGFIFLLFGFLFAAGYLGYKKTSASLFLKKPVQLSSEREFFAVVICGTILLLLAGFYMYQGLPSVTNALLGMVAGDDVAELAEQVTANRVEITKGYYFGGAYRGQGVIMALMRVGWPFLISMALIVYLKTKKILWMVFIFILFLLSFVFIAGNGTRAPFLNTIIIYMILFSLVKRIRIKFVIIAFSSIVLLGILLSSYSNKLRVFSNSDNLIITAIVNILNRILIGNAINDVYAIEFVREGIIKYRWGLLHLRDLQAAFPGVSGGIPFSNELAQLLHPERMVTTFATGTYITKPFVDFGIVGVGFIFLFLGLFAGFSQKFIISRTRKDPIHLAMSAMLIFYISLIVLNSPMSIISSLLMLLLFYFFVQAIIRFYRMMNFYFRRSRRPSSPNQVY